MPNLNPTYNIKPEVLQAASALGVPASALHEVIHAESNHNPKAVNYQNGKMYAVGVIQFVASTAKALGTTLAALYGMTYAQQMLYVVKYYQQFGKQKLAKVRDGFDLYCLTFWPAWFEASENSQLPSYAYKVNTGMDLDKSKSITKAECRKWFAKRIGSISAAPVSEKKKPLIAGVLIVAGFMWLIYQLPKMLLSK